MIEPATPFVGGWHIDAVCDHLEAVTQGAIRNLVILIPPRHTKSTLTSVCWPVWDWIAHPAHRFLFASYSAGLSTEHAVLSRRILDSPWYQARWGQRFRLTTDQNVKTHFEHVCCMGAGRLDRCGDVWRRALRPAGAHCGTRV